jgi:hypothetical protein
LAIETVQERTGGGKNRADLPDKQSGQAAFNSHGKPFGFAVLTSPS